MNTQSEKTGSEEMTDQDYERAKEMVKQRVDNLSSKNSYPEVFSNTVSFLMGMFKRRGYIPVSLLEYANKASIEKVIGRWVR